MKIVANPALGHRILDELQAEYHQDKPLPHLTELIYCLTKSYYDRVDPLPATDREILLFSTGWGLERLLLGQDKDREYKQCDGISYEPDPFYIRGLPPGELKTGRMATKTIPEKGIAGVPDSWKKQMLGYMHCEGLLEYELAILHIIPADLSTWHITATKEELDENWEWILARNEVYQDRIHNSELPIPYSWNDEWECKWCRYKIRCQVSKEG